MRKSTTYHYSKGDVRQYVKDELKTTNYKLDNVSKRVESLSERVDSLSERFDSLSQKFDEFKNRIFDLLDKVMGELKAIREEQTIISGYKDQIEDHDTRIGKIEESLDLRT